MMIHQQRHTLLRDEPDKKEVKILVSSIARDDRKHSEARRRKAEKL